MSDKPTQYAPGGIINNQTGGTANNIVNNHFDKPPRHIAAETRASLSGMVPKDKPVSVLYRNGDREAMSLAQEIYDFLKGAGYQVQPDGIGWHMFGVQSHAITVTPFNDGSETHVLVESQ